MLQPVSAASASRTIRLRSRHVRTGGSTPARPTRHPVGCILSWNGEQRLPATIASVEPIADEIVVGVDADSAGSHARPGAGRRRSRVPLRPPGDARSPRGCWPWRRPPLTGSCCSTTTSAWSPSFRAPASRRCSPTSDTRTTPSRASGSSPGDAGRYVRALPWFPDWQVRLFRNDRPAGVARAGVPLRVPGDAAWDAARTGRAPALRTLAAADRRARAQGAAVPQPRGRGPVRGVLRAASRRRRPRRWSAVEAEPPRRRALAARAGVLDPTESRGGEAEAPLPPWGARLDVRLPDAASGRGAQFVAGWRRRTPAPSGGLPPRCSGRGCSSPTTCAGATARCSCGTARARRSAGWSTPGSPRRSCRSSRPRTEPGDYVLEWDLVDEGECWFAECGSATGRCRSACRRLADAALAPGPVDSAHGDQPEDAAREATSRTARRPDPARTTRAGGRHGPRRGPRAGGPAAVRWSTSIAPDARVPVHVPPLQLRDPCPGTRTLRSPRTLPMVCGYSYTGGTASGGGFR